MKKILYIAGEALPFASSGGLGDVIGSLPIALSEQKEDDIRVILPLYGQVTEKYRKKMKFLFSKTIKLSWRNQYCGVFEYKQKGVTYYFLDNEYYFKRASLYGEFDDAERFAFFCRAAMEILPDIDFIPDILHAHDWHAALSVIYLKQCYAKIDERFKDTKAIFTIHNIQYQGIYDFAILGDVFGLMESDREIVEYDGCINLLKGAIVCADRVTTVSPTYAREILSPKFSHGLDTVLGLFSFKLSGILNGIDKDYYNPSKDTEIFANFSSRNTDGKALCKSGLQRMLGLPERDVPLIAVISRLVSHKGLDLVMLAGEDLLRDDVQLVVLGMGDKSYEAYFEGELSLLVEIADGKVLIGNKAVADSLENNYGKHKLSSILQGIRYSDLSYDGETRAYFYKAEDKWLTLQFADGKIYSLVLQSVKNGEMVTEKLVFTKYGKTVIEE